MLAVGCTALSLSSLRKAVPHEIDTTIVSNFVAPAIEDAPLSAEFLLGAELCPASCALQPVNALLNTVVVKVADPKVISEGGFDLTISNVKCGSFCLCETNVTESNLDLTAKIDGIALNCSGDFQYKYKKLHGIPHGKGSINVTINSSNFAVGGSIETNPTAKEAEVPLKSVMIPNSCKAEVNFGGLHFSGGMLAKVASLFRSKIESVVKSEVAEKGCKFLKNAIEHDGTLGLQKLFEMVKNFQI
eukprot:g1615.t1